MAAKANLCDIKCPLTAINHYEYTERNKERGAFAKAKAAGALSIFGLQQAAYAGGQCPQRQLQEKDWEPSNRCAALTRDMAAKLGRPITASSLSEHQQAVLPAAGIEIVDDLTPPEETPPTDTPPAPSA